MSRRIASSLFSVTSVALLLVLGLVVSACGNGSSEEPPALPRNVAESDYRTTSSDLKIYDFEVGDGATAQPGDQVRVHYTGWLKSDSTRFDSSIGRNPLSFRLGQGQVIEGWDEGVAGMKVGGERQLVIPPELGYGSSGAGNAIPPDATLIFEVELLEIP